MKDTLNHLATCKKEPFAPTEEQSAALREGFRLARRNRQAGAKSFYWKTLAGVVKFKKEKDVVIVKSVPKAVIYRWQRRQLRR